MHGGCFVALGSGASETRRASRARIRIGDKCPLVPERWSRCPGHQLWQRSTMTSDSGRLQPVSVQNDPLWCAAVRAGLA